MDDPVTIALGEALGDAGAAKQLVNWANSFSNIPNTIAGCAKLPSTPALESLALELLADPALAMPLGLQKYPSFLDPSQLVGPTPTQECWMLLTLAARMDGGIIDRIAPTLTGSHDAKNIDRVRKSAAKHAAARSQVDSRSAPTGKSGTAGLRFTDFGVKLAVIDALMYEQQVLAPKFDVRTFAAEHPDTPIDLETEVPIPEVVRYFEQLPITEADAAHVTELVFDSGNEVYRHLIPLWDGEDDSFDVQSWADVDLLPNLERVVLLMIADPETIAEQLAARGIEVEL